MLKTSGFTCGVGIGAMIRVEHQALQRFATQLLQAGGVPPQEAQIVAQSLVEANLCGHDSHGVMRIPYYLEEIGQGNVRPGAPLEVFLDRPEAVAADAHWGLGQVQARRLMQMLIQRTQEHAVCVGTLVHCAHIGRLGEYCQMATQQGRVAMVVANTHGATRRVAPPGGTAPRLGTNPIAFGIPTSGEPILLDFGTSATAEGKVRLRRIAGQECPPGWLLDPHGQPTTDPNVLYGDPPGTILPMGGPGQTYKGFGLALVVEVLAGALSGGVTSRPQPPNQKGNCVFMLVLNPQHLGRGQNHFAAEVGQLVEFVRDCPRAPGVEQILLPGDPERLTRQKRLQEGVPFDPGNWQALLQLAQRLGVEPPQGG